MSRIGNIPSTPAMQPKSTIGRNERVPAAPQGRSGMRADFEKAAVAAGVDPSKLKDIQAKIQAKMMDARNNPNSGFNLYSAIDDVLQENGADLDTFRATMKQLANDRRGGDVRQVPAPIVDNSAKTPGVQPGGQGGQGIKAGKVDVVG